jgi:hypothetical protein
MTEVALTHHDGALAYPELWRAKVELSHVQDFPWRAKLRALAARSSNMHAAKENLRAPSFESRASTLDLGARKFGVRRRKPELENVDP